MFEKQQQNKAIVEETNKAHQKGKKDESDSEKYNSESDTDSKEEMSFTSDEGNTDALNILALCVNQEKTKAL